MPEGPEVDTDKLHETISERLEKEGGDFLKRIAVTTAVLAAFAAVAALQAGATVNEALLLKTEATRAQAEASDQWAYYQAKSVKSTIYATQAAASKSSNPDLAAKAQQEAERYATEEAEVSKAAKDFEKEAHEETQLSAHSLEHHHRFAYAVTMFQVSIALAAVAALSRQKAMWLVGLAISMIGIVYFLDGFWLFF